MIQFFPLRESPRNEAFVPQPSGDEVDEQAFEALQAIMVASSDGGGSEPSESESDVVQPEYEAFREVKDLPDVARKLYTVTGENW